MTLPELIAKWEKELEVAEKQLNHATAFHYVAEQREWNVRHRVIAWIVQDLKELAECPLPTMLNYHWLNPLEEP